MRLRCYINMKELNMLVWLTQLGLSIAIPLGGFTLLGIWLRNRFELGVWVVLCLCAVGFAAAVNALRYNLKAMALMEKNMTPKKADPPAVSFTDHE